VLSFVDFNDGAEIYLTALTNKDIAADFNLDKLF